METIQKRHYHLGGIHKDENYRDMVAVFVQSYKAMRCNTPVSVHFLDCHLDVFPQN
jgi:hypothetical protein